MNRILIAGLLAASMALPCFAADLRVEVQGILKAEGVLMVSVFDKADTWLRKPLKFERILAQAGSVKAVFADLPEGEYSVSVIHDENSNGKFDTNPLGIPIEPWGFSNDASGMFGRAKFDDAKFRLVPAGAAIVINLKG